MPTSGEEMNESGVEPKKKFDKKKWRELKYSKGAKIKQWEENRKKNMKHKLNQQLRKEGVLPKNPDKETRNQIQEKIKSNPFHTLQEKKKAKEEHRKESIRKEKEKQIALQNYKNKKIDKLKKLSRKNRKGQPLMNPRVQLLYQQIQKSINGT